MLLGIIAWSVCGILLVLTVLCQRPRWKWLKSLKYRDVAAVIPAWTFFAPNPGKNDTRLLWRELRCDGSISVWHEVVPPSGGLLRAVWNPGKREAKAISDAGPMVLRMLTQNPKNQLTLVSLPYLVLLNRISSAPRTPLSVARQFLVLQTTGVDAASGGFQPLLLSRWHALEQVPRESVAEALQLVGGASAPPDRERAEV